MDEAIAEKVDQMTKIVMAATADAWLIHIPGSTQRHEIFTAEQLAQDSSNLEDLVCSSLQDSEDDSRAGCVEHFLSHCLFTGTEDASLDSKSGSSLSFLYRELEKLASAKKPAEIPVLVQTRAQKGELPLVPATKKRKHNPRVGENRTIIAIKEKQRQSSLSSWIGKQL